LQRERASASATGRAGPKGLAPFHRPEAARVRFLLRRVRALAGAGAELVAAGRLDRAEDIFFFDCWQGRWISEPEPLHKYNGTGRRALPEETGWPFAEPAVAAAGGRDAGS
jgi:hypothetical protein